MPLESVKQNAFPGSFQTGIGVGMKDGNRAVTVFATPETLRSLEPTATDGDMAVFLRHRDRIEAVGSAKFDAGEIQSGAIIFVTSADLNRPLS